MLMIKAIKAQVKTGLESIEILKNGSMFGYPSCSIEGIPIVRNTAMVRATGAVGGLATMNAMTGSPMIVVEKRLSSDVERFIIRHELAHIKNGDLKKVDTVFKSKVVMLKRMFGHVPEEEILADACAIETVGIESALKAMDWLYQKTYSSEIKKRIEIMVKDNMKGAEKRD